MRYSREFEAQDITYQLAENPIPPILSMLSLHDDLSTREGDLGKFQSWHEWLLDEPDLPVSIVHVDNSRSLIYLDHTRNFRFILQAIH